MERLGETLRGTWLVQGHITYEKEEPGLKTAVSSEHRPWLHPGLPRLRGGLCGSHWICTWPMGVGEQSETQRFPWGALCKGPRQRTQEMMSLPGNRTQQNPEPRYPGLHSREEPPTRLLAAKIFCCLLLPRGRGLSRAQRESGWERGQHWLSASPREASGPLPERTER